MIGRPIPAAYREARDFPCPTCGAEPGDYCVVDDERHGPRLRRVPCVRRCPPSSQPIPDDEPRRSSRSFSEPLHGDPDDQART